MTDLYDSQIVNFMGQILVLMTDFNHTIFFHTYELMPVLSFTRSNMKSQLFSLHSWQLMAN